MAKKVTAIVKLQIPAGQANPAPPVGPALGQQGVNIMAFCKDFNEKTREKAGWNIPVKITVYEDKSFDFIMKQPPASRLLLKKAGKDKGSGKPQAAKIAKITDQQLTEIAEQKMEDMNAASIETAKKSIAGTARSMGITVEGY